MYQIFYPSKGPAAEVDVENAKVRDSMVYLGLQRKNFQGPEAIFICRKAGRNESGGLSNGQGHMGLGQGFSLMISRSLSCNTKE